jgi:hypothetical protein
MAIGIHVVRVGIFPVDSTGTVRSKNDPTVTIKQQLQTSSDHRVIPDVVSIPNSANYPTVKTYLELEAVNNYVLQYMDQNMIVTYLRNSTGGYP